MRFLMLIVSFVCCSISAAVPEIRWIAPNFGDAAGGTTVIITGVNLTGATVVTFGGTNAASFTVNFDTPITATTPAHLPSPVNVVVTTPDGSTTHYGSFTYREQSAGGVAWGYNESYKSSTHNDLNQVVAIAAGENDTVALSCV